MSTTATKQSYQSVFAPGLFAGQVVVVTGGGSGIGRCTAHELSALGAQVVLIGRKAEKLEAVAAELLADNPRSPAASWHVCDIRHEATVVATVQAIALQHGHIDGLVNNAGGQYVAPLAKIGLKGWDAVVATNLTGGFLMARECYVQSMQARGGAIVNIVADFWGSMPGMGHSGAARAGMVSFTETAAVEWAHSGVRVNAVAPGYIASNGMDHYPPEMADKLRANRYNVPLGRYGNEAEVSAGIVFLLSPAASFVSGTVTRIDGARPQLRHGWGAVHATGEALKREAIAPFGGFHRYVGPKVFQDDADTAPEASAEASAHPPAHPAGASAS